MFNLAIQAGKVLQKLHIPFLQEAHVRGGFFERDHSPASLVDRFRCAGSQARSTDNEKRERAHVPDEA